jgi:diadenosine tetraphosphatase ApaH/serine/threonine PP2A family protein phosphatase
MCASKLFEFDSFHFILVFMNSFGMRLFVCFHSLQLDDEARKAVATARRHQQQLESLEIRASRTTMPNRPMLRHEDLPNWKSQSIEEINWYMFACLWCLHTGMICDLILNL